MNSLLKFAALSVVAVTFTLCGAQAAKADRFVYRSYYAGPYYAGTEVVYRRPFAPFYAPRVAYYPAAVPVYAAPVYSAPVYSAVPSVVNYPAATVTGYRGTTVYYNYGASYAPAVPAVVYPLPSVVYPPAVFPY